MSQSDKVSNRDFLGFLFGKLVAPLEQGVKDYAAKTQSEPKKETEHGSPKEDEKEVIQTEGYEVPPQD